MRVKEQHYWYILKLQRFISWQRILRLWSYERCITGRNYWHWYPSLAELLVLIIFKWSWQLMSLHLLRTWKLYATETHQHPCPPYLLTFKTAMFELTWIPAKSDAGTAYCLLVLLLSLLLFKLYFALVLKNIYD